MDNMNAILERLKAHFGVSTDKQLAPKLGVGETTVPQWRKRGFIPEKKLYEIANKQNLSFEWLVDGMGVKQFPFLGSGTDTVLETIAAKTKVVLPAFAHFTPRARWQQKTSNDMSPEIESGEYVVVDDIREITGGGIYFVEANGDKYILRLHVDEDNRYTFKPDADNTAKEVSYPAQCRIIGQVIYILKDLSKIDEE
jgi:hypothetical protein